MSRLAGGPTAAPGTYGAGPGAFGKRSPGRSSGEGLCGEIIDQPEGANGFGYDPHFYLPDMALTAASLEPEEKNRVSHRARALRELLGKLSQA